MRTARPRTRPTPTVPRPPSPAPTAGQAAFLAGLTPAEWESLLVRPGVMNTFMAWFLAGPDLILSAEADRLLGRPQPPHRLPASSPDRKYD